MMMKVTWMRLLTVLIALSFLAACSSTQQLSPSAIQQNVAAAQQSGDEPSNAPNAAEEEPLVVPTPSPDKATATGRVWSSVTQGYLEGMMVRLAEVYGHEETDNKIFAVDESLSPLAFTDANGYFVMPDIPPREYVLVIGDVNSALPDQVITEAGNKDKAIIWEAKAGEILELKPNGEEDIVVDFDW